MWRTVSEAPLPGSRGIRLRRTALALLLGVSACSLPMNASLVNPPGSPFVLAGVADLTQVCQLTGQDSFNQTERQKVAGTDLGSSFQAGDRTWFVFGDTFGERPADSVGGVGTIWRSNALAFTSDSDPSDCIRFDGFITDEVGWAREILDSKKRDDIEVTVIPTHGFEANGQLYLHYMSVKHWGPPGEWETNLAGLARSSDAGQTWDKLPDVTWPGGGSFQQVSVAKVDSDIYFWGIPAGRLGGVQLMKVAEADVENASAYRYFSGLGDDGRPAWSADPANASTILDRETGELSVVWNTYLQRWIMTTMADNENAVMYEGLNPWGPWGQAISLFTQTELPGLYAPFMNGTYSTNDGRTVYFTLSLWGPYNVFWYRADLVKGP